MRSDDDDQEKSERCTRSTELAKRIRQRAIQGKVQKTPVRRSLRSTRASQKNQAEQKAANEKAEQLKCEREAKLTVLRKPEPLRCSECVYDDIVFQLGDTVNVRGEDGNKYYAVIIAFWSNQFCEKAARIRWLIPKYDMTHPIWKDEDPEDFKPSLFREACLNEKLAPLKCIEFVGRFTFEVDETFGEPFVVYHNNNVINLTTPAKTLGCVNL